MKQLRNSGNYPNDFFYSVIESLKDYAVFTMDTNRIITSWNIGAEKLLGYSEKEIIGQCADILFTLDDQKRKAPDKEESDARKKGAALDERWHVKKDGTMFWSSGKMFPLKKDQQIVGFTKIMRDSSKEKVVGERLLLTEELNRKLLEATTDYVKILDLKGTILSINNSGVRLMEFNNISEVLGKNWLQFWKGEHRKLAEKTLKSAKTGKVAHFIGNRLTAKGNSKWWDVVITPIFNEQGKVHRLLVVSRDITKLRQDEEEKKRLLKELEIERSRLKEVFVEAPALIVVLKGKKHVFEMVNKSFTDFVGNRNIIGKTVREALPEINGQGFNKILDEVFKTGKTFTGDEMPIQIQRIPGKDLETKYIDLVFQPIKDINGNVDFIFAHGYDVTEQVKARHQVEELLGQQQKDQKRIEFAQQAGKIGTFEWDVTTNKSTWTKEFEALYGYTNGGFNSGSFERWLKYVHPEDRKTVETITAQSLKDKKETEFNIEFRIIWPDKSIHYLVTRAQIIRDKKGKALQIIGVNIDITERKIIENNLYLLSKVSKVLSSSLDYKTTLSNIANLAVSEMADWCTVHMKTTDGIEQVALAHKDPKMVKWAWELNKKNPTDPDAPTGVPHVIRTGEMEYYPYITDELITKSAKTEEQAKLLRKLNLTSIIMAPITIDKETIGVISFISCKKGRLYSKEDVLIAQEVASRASAAVQNAKLYESAQENEAKFKAFVDSNIVGVFTSDNKGNVLEANDGFLRIIGYSRQDLQDGKINRWKLTPTEYHDEDNKAIDELYSRGSTTPWEKEYIKPDGSQVPVIVGSTLINKETGENITIVLDITERKRLEQRKDEFIGIASHELKTPLTSIKGYTQILERIIQQMSNDRLKLYLKKTNIYINRLDSLITDLLDVSRIQAGKLQFNLTKFDLYTLVRDSIDAVQPTSTQHKILCNDCKHVKIYGDLHRLEQVFMNLLSNAIKYSPEANKIIVNVEKKGKYVQISVQDFGIGIPKKNISKLFKRFYRVEKTATQFSGLGIGLYISAEIVIRHGGSIWAESTEGKGSTFYFTLPIAKTK